MLSFARRAFTFAPEPELFLSISDNRHPAISKLNLAADLSIGLRLVLDNSIPKTDSPPPNRHSAVLQKQLNTFQSIAASIAAPIATGSPDLGRFLTSCNFCRKPLRSGEDVFMYMGDQGFCSVECRMKQIAMDERREVEEALDRRLLASASSPSSASDSPNCPNGDHCETCRLLADLRRRRQSRKSARR